MTDVPTLRRCVVAGRVSFVDLRGVVAELIPIWKTVREYVRFTSSPHLKSSTDRVSCVGCFVFSFFLLLGYLVGFLSCSR